jgi:prevent-host-death family protein
MLVETDNLVSAEQLRKGLNKYLKAANQGRGPIAVTHKSEVVGFLLGAREYEALFGAAVRNLLESRTDGATVSHEEVRDHVKAMVRSHSRKP